MLRDTSKTHIVSALVSLCYEVSPMFMYVLQVLIPEYVSFSAAFSIMGFACTALSISAGWTHLTLRETKEIDIVNGLIDLHERCDPDVEASTGIASNAASDNHRDVPTQKGSSSLLQHVLHPRFMLHVLFMTIINTKNQFYVATFADQIEYFSTKEEVSDTP